MFEQLLNIAFAGLWSEAWHLGIAVCLLALFVIGAIFSPVGKKDFALGAVLVAIFLGAESLGIHLEKQRVEAQQTQVQNDVTTAVAKTTTPKAKAKGDPWDRRDY